MAEQGLTEGHPGLEEEVKKFFAADTNGDGKVSKEEFIAYAEKAIDEQFAPMMQAMGEQMH